MTGFLVFALVAYGTVLTVVGAALCRPAADTVLEVNTQQQEPVVTFPTSVSNTPLIVLGPVCYEGPFSEAEGSEPIANGLALLLENTSDRELLYAQVTLENKEKAYCFAATHIPPEGKILVVEAGGAQWSDESYTACTGTVKYAASQSLSESVVQIQDGDMGGVNLTNVSNMPISKLRLYYKNYLPDQNIYLGGGTFTTIVENLLPGQARYVPLKFYASGASCILKAELVA